MGARTDLAGVDAVGGLPLVEKLGLATSEAVTEPCLGGVVEKGESVEEGDTVLGKRVDILRYRGMDGGVDEREEVCVQQQHAPLLPQTPTLRQ